ncbi:MAG: SCO family protein [Bacteroidetes bacterium]|nr:SCO family protein [Bacteroidota bacterium]
MSGKRNTWTYGIIIIVLIISSSIFAAYNIQKRNTRHKALPVFGPKAEDGRNHKVSQFNLTNQYGETVTNETFDGKIYVTDFFFTTCQTICPKMSNNLNIVYKAFAKDDDVRILSHTVDPETDSVATLKTYADELGVTDKRWLFVTGDKKQIYSLARKSYFAATDDGDGGVDDFVHTQNLILIDRDFEIRGYYDGTNPAEITKLITDIRKLKTEH